MIRFLLFLKRRAWPIAFALVVCTGILLGTLFYWYPFRGAKAQTFMLERQLKEKKAEKEALQKLYETLKNKYQAIESDRDNVLVQIKQLLAEKEAFVFKETEFKTLTVKDQELLESYKKLEAEFGAAQAKANDLKKSLELAVSESATNKAALDKVFQEKADMALEFKNSSGKIKNLEEEAARYKVFQESFMSLNNSYEALKKQKKDLEKQLKNIPKKLSKTAHENKVLIRETADMHYNLGVFYAGERNYDRALAEFKKAVDINPNDSKAYYNLGYIYAEHLQDRKKAEYNFRRFLGLDSDDPNADSVKSYLAERETFTTNVLKS